MKEIAKELLDEYNAMDFNHIDDVYFWADKVADFLTDFVYDE